mmetsp:Transcript_20798/g.19822  ORF Transcript_20798/g.19822 Transcript_20798/m.19822 type:complete len:190 (+) Transcript_20798:1675-2244(+)
MSDTPSKSGRRQPAFFPTGSPAKSVEPSSEMSQRLQMIVSINEQQTKQLKQKMERFTTDQSKIHQSSLNEVTNAKQSLTQVIISLSRKYEGMLAEFQKVMNQSIDDNKMFKDTMIMEYADFFKNKHKIINNFSFFASKTQEQIQKFKEEFDVSSKKTVLVSEVLPLLFDVVNFIFHIQQEDLKERTALA